MNELLKEIDKVKKELTAQFLSKELDLIDLILVAVESSTLRSYKNTKKYTPSSIYRTWAFKFINDNIEMLKIDIDFKLIHEKAYKSLKNYWNIDGSKIEDYQVFKLIDLTFKNFCRASFLNQNRRKWYFNVAYTPLDKFSLSCLKVYHPEYSKSIPNDVSMNYVKNKIQYYKIQNDIKVLMNNGSQILYDLYAWEIAPSHQKPTNFKLIEKEKKKY